jgi:hypothetical protein
LDIFTSKFAQVEVIKNNPMEIRKVLTIYQGVLNMRVKIILGTLVKSIGNISLSSSTFVRGIKMPMITKTKPITIKNISAAISDASTSTNSTYTNRIRERE